LKGKYGDSGIVTSFQEKVQEVKEKVKEKAGAGAVESDEKGWVREVEKEDEAGHDVLHDIYDAPVVVPEQVI
jgi:hypothetical protein